MPRGLTPAQRAAAKSRVKAPVYLVELQLASATLNLWNGEGPLTALGVSWSGLREFGIIEGLENNRALRSGAVTLQLSGVPSEGIPGGVISATRNERYQGRPVAIYVGFLEPNNMVSLLHDPVLIWDGFADVLTMQLGATFNAALTCEHYDSHLRRANGERMTVEQHSQAVGIGLGTDLFFAHQDRLMGRPKPLLGV